MHKYLYWLFKQLHLKHINQKESSVENNLETKYYHMRWWELDRNHLADDSFCSK